LNPGAPVKYRGVTIGKVAEVLIRHNQASNDFSMPVIISIDKKLAQSKSDEQLEIGSEERLNLLIQQGFRGGLDADSLVTGVLYIALDIVPNAPPPHLHQLTPEYQEIPTMPTPIQQLLATLANSDFGGLAQRLNRVLTRLDSGLSQLNIGGISAEATNLLRSAHELITTLNLTNSIAGVTRTLDRAEALLKRIDGRVDPLVDHFTNTLSDAQQTLAEARRGIQSVVALLGPDASLRADVSQALEELTGASRAIADLAEFIQRNPNAVLTGRKRARAEP